MKRKSIFQSTMGLKWLAMCAALLAVSGQAIADGEPVVTVVSAEMRTGTTIMDVVYRVDDPDDATVKVRALAFIDGIRSFANVIRPETWVEGTEANLGDAIATGVEHTLSWDVAADWDIDLGNIKLEVLCRDSRGLLPFDWITIPATGGSLELTISENSPADADVLDAFLWQYSDGDPSLSLNNGGLYGNISSHEFNGINLVSGTDIRVYGIPYICKQINFIPASIDEVVYANTATRDSYNESDWHVVPQAYDTISVVVEWGAFSDISTAAGLTDVADIASGQDYSLALSRHGTVVAWGDADVPADLSDVVKIDAGNEHNLALKSDGTIVAWGDNSQGQINVPTNLTDLIDIAAVDGDSIGGAGGGCIVLKSNGTVVAWGQEYYGLSDVPPGLSNVVAIAGGGRHCLALVSNGTVVAWGNNDYGQTNVPAGVTNVVAIAGGGRHSLAIKSDGSVVAWGSNNYGQCDVPIGLTNVMAVAGGGWHSMALKEDGTVVTWGWNSYGQTDAPPHVTNVVAIAAGRRRSVVVQ